MYLGLLIRSIEERLGCFRGLAIMNKPAMNIHMHIFVWRNFKLIWVNNQGTPLVNGSYWNLFLIFVWMDDGDVCTTLWNVLNATEQYTEKCLKG